jgi:uncharacterized protein (TIGR02001 family)
MNLKSLLLSAALISAAPAVVLAQDAATTTANIGVASSYQFRGVNQNVNNDTQIFGGLDVSGGSFYIGTWLSNVDFGGDANLEVDIYAGYKPKLGPVSLDLGVLAYFYPEDDDLRVFEAKAAGTIANEAGASLTGSVFYSPEAGKDGPSYWYGELAGSVPLSNVKLGPFALSLTGSVGTADYESGFALKDYTNWKVGFSAASENGWVADLFYTDTDISNDKLYEGKTVVQLKRNF